MYNEVIAIVLTLGIIIGLSVINRRRNSSGGISLKSSNSSSKQEKHDIHLNTESIASHSKEFEIHKQIFQKNNKDSYGYNNTIDSIRENDFKHLNGSVYLDHTASTLYSNTQIQNVMNQLQSNLYCNPHSMNPIGLNTNQEVENAREKVLEFFNAPYKQYSVIFTSGCTDSLKKVGEYFNWDSNSHFYYSLDCHNSLLGIREYATEKKSTLKPISSTLFKLKESDKDNQVNVNNLLNILDEANQQQEETKSNSLLAFPAQCNYNGSKYNLDIINAIKSNEKKFQNIKILLDVASLVGTSKFDLSLFPVDFLALSFYKLFGYPSGLGALIVRNDSIKYLNKIYFSGGTVNSSMSNERFHVFRDNVSQKFEDGTISYLSISSLKYGFQILQQLQMDNIMNHTFSLVKYLYDELTSLKHSNGQPLVTIYTDNTYQSSKTQGAIINFNLKRSNQELIGYNEVEKLASLKNIYLRTGCFCNPGACHRFLNLNKKDILNHLEKGHVCWDDKDIIDGKITGSLRISLGYMSNFKDIYEFIMFLKETFIDEQTKQLSLEEEVVDEIEEEESIYLKEINVYPVKSFGAFKVDKWELGPSGLLYDREWTLVDQNGVYINQKKLPILSLTHTSIDLDTMVLTINAPNMEEIEIPLDYYPITSMDSIQVCGDKVDGLLYGKDDVELMGGLDISDWMYRFTGKQCHLVRKSPDSHRVSRLTQIKQQQQQEIGQQQLDQAQSNKEISFSNESPFLLINESSVKELKQRVIKRNQEMNNNNNNEVDQFNWITNDSFRANFVVKGGREYQEDSWEQFTIGNVEFKTIGLCNRCKMICINQSIGVEEREPLATLSTYRRNGGKIVFGQHLQYTGCKSNNNNYPTISVNSKITITKYCE